MKITQREIDTCSLYGDSSPWLAKFCNFTLAHVFDLISESIHISPLITTIKKNKIISLIFNVGLNIFTNSSFFIFIPTSLYLCFNIYLF